ncbi:hypothetical protein [Tabrizicola sp. BL-A-41-H6]|uniref:hypothetical protein n=1 Tax=Tabrizicola sp. BL-A-41-H6 TaxID=3421107 RepID=UPI003D6754C2
MTLRLPLPPLDDYRHVDQGVFRQRLTLRDIMTPRCSFANALRRETVRQAFSGMPDYYDCLPVIDGDDRASVTAPIVGVVDRHRANVVARVQDEMDDAEPISADLPLIDFVARAAGTRFSLVSDPAADAVVGLVTIHDLARLSARLAIFALLLEVEEKVGEVIARFAGPDEFAWARFLSARREKPNRPSPREDFEKCLRRARDKDGSGSVLLEMGLSQKLSLLYAMRSDILGPRLLIPDKLTDLRNTIAHGRPFAHRGKATKLAVPVHDVPAIVRNVRSLSEALGNKLRSMS